MNFTRFKGKTLNLVKFTGPKSNNLKWLTKAYITRNVYIGKCLNQEYANTNIKHRPNDHSREIRQSLGGGKR